jgi:hypothetical protein
MFGTMNHASISARRKKVGYAVPMTAKLVGFAGGDFSDRFEAIEVEDKHRDGSKLKGSR